MISIKKRKKIKSKLIGLVYILIVSGILGYFGYLVILPFFPPKIDRSDNIYIRTDDDFLVYRFPGSGTENDPYIIENYKILTSAEFAIYIHGVSKYVIIRNNFLHSQEINIAIGSVCSNTIKIINNTCVGSVYSTWAWSMGISIYDTDGCYIYNNTCLNLYRGIKLYNCSNCIIINNHLKNNDQNIQIDSCSNINIENNSLIVYKQVGGYYCHESLYIGYCTNINIKMNVFENSGLYIYESNASSFIVKDNLVNGFELGYFVDEINLEINSLSIFGQLFFINCNNSIIKDQEIKATNYGIFLINCLNINISSCNCSYNFCRGIGLGYSENITIINSTFSNNYYGISVSSSNTVILFNSTFSNNNIGTLVSYSNNINLFNNTFNNNEVGIYSYHSDCIYTQNYFFNNTDDVIVS